MQLKEAIRLGGVGGGWVGEAEVEKIDLAK